MSYINNKWNLLVGLIILAIFIVGVGILFSFYPLIMKRINLNLRKKERKSARYSDGELYPIMEESNFSETEAFLEQSKISKNTDVNCIVEYRTRGSQLIVSFSKVTPSSHCFDYIENLKNVKMNFIVFLNGDYTNSPCESTMKPMGKVIDVNEIFIFTIMPYDLPSMELIIQAILVSDNQKCIIGTLKMPLYELDQQMNVIQKTYSLPFPDEPTILPDCLLCLSIMSCKNLIKVKIIRLHIMDCKFPGDNVSGLSIRLILESPDKPVQTFDSTKKKYKSSLMFNETLIFETMDLDKKSLQLNIQLLESCRSNDGEVVIVCGTIMMGYGVFKETSFNQNWMEALDNLDTEIVRWYPISYDKSNK